MKKMETGVQDLLVVLNGFINEGNFPEGKPTAIRKYLASVETAEVALLSLELNDEDYFQSVLSDFRSRTSKFFNRFVSLQKIDPELAKTAGELIQLVRSIEIALRVTMNPEPGEFRGLDRQFIIEFCSDTISELSNEEMDELLKGAIHLQLATIRRMAEFPEAFSDRTIQKETKIMMADLLHDWERLKKSHEGLAGKLRGFGGKILQNGPLAIGYIKQVLPLLTGPNDT